MVYCGSGTETFALMVFAIIKNDSMVYCGSGTETNIFWVIHKNSS